MYDSEIRSLERKAGFITRHADLYQTDPTFKKFVDNTVYLSAGQMAESSRAVADHFGTRWTEFRALKERVSI